jgi:hypothetical protein
LENLPDKVPFIALQDLVSALIPYDVEAESEIELVIVFESFDLNIREFIAFLSFADRIYGRLKNWNLYRYSQLTRQQLHIAEFRFGSIEAVITETILTTKDYLIPLAVLFFALRSLKPVSETTKNFADSYKSLKDAEKASAEIKKLNAETIKINEETKLVRINRKKLEAEFKQDEFLRELDQKRINQLITLLRELFKMEKRYLPKAKKFIDRKVKDVKLQIRGKQNK